MHYQKPRAERFFLALIAVLAVNDVCAQIPVSVVHRDSFQAIKVHFTALEPLTPTVYELNPSSLINDKGQEVFLVPDGQGSFWTFDRGPDADVTIRLRENVVVMPEQDATVSFMDLKSGSFKIEGPIGMPASTLPEFRGFSSESDEGGFINMYETGLKLDLSGIRFIDTHADGSGGKGGVLSIRGGKASFNGVWFDNNTTEGDGGAINATGSSRLTVRDSFVLGNYGGNFGGGIYFAGDKLTITNTVFAENIAGQRGGNLDIHGGSRVMLKGNFGFEGVGSLIGDGFHIDPDDDTEITVTGNMFLGASNCNSLTLTYSQQSDVSYNMVDNNRYNWNVANFSGMGGLGRGNLFSSRTRNCPRVGSGLTDSGYNVDAGGMNCASLGLNDISASGMTTRISIDDLKLNIAYRTKLFDIVQQDLNNWDDSEKLLDPVPTYVWFPTAFQNQKLKSASGSTQAEQPGVTDNCPLADAVGLARPQDGNGDGTPACDAGPLEQQNGPDIGSGQSGAFYDINRNGEGIFVQMLDDNSAVVYVFSYTPAGEQMWLLGVGEVTGNSIVFPDMLLPSGPSFGPDYDPAQLVFSDWGRMSVHWPSCAVPQSDPGVMTFQSRDDAYGKVRVFTGRLTQPVACEGAEQHENAAWSGSYFLPEENGHGIVVEVLPDGSVVMIWYLYDETGKQRWVLGTGQLVGNRVEIADIRMPAGALWGDAFDPADVVDQVWGSAKLTFNSCSEMVVEYTSIQGERTMTMTRLVTLAGAACTP